MNLKEIIRDWLVAHKCDGLCNEIECGCRLDDLMPCGNPGVDCVAARSGDPPDDADPDLDFWMYPIAKDEAAEGSEDDE